MEKVKKSSKIITILQMILCGFFIDMFFTFVIGEIYAMLSLDPWGMMFGLIVLPFSFLSIVCMGICVFFIWRLLKKCKILKMIIGLIISSLVIGGIMIVSIKIYEEKEMESAQAGILELVTRRYGDCNFQIKGYDRTQKGYLTIKEN